MIAAFFSLFLLLGAGIAYRWIRNVPPPSDVRRIIGSIVLNIFLPALTFHVLYTAPETTDLIAVPAVSIVTILGTAALAWLVYGLLLRRRLAGPTIGALILAAAWCNATYLGLPVTAAMIGDHVRRVPVLFDLLGMSPMLFTLGTLIAVEYGTKGERHTIGEALRQIVTLPPLVAAVAGITLNLLDVPLPNAIGQACEMAGRCVAPLMIFAVGLALRPPQWKILPWTLPSVAIKLIVAPLLASPLIHLWITDPDVLRAATLEAGMPTMVLTMVFAERYGLDEAILAQTILVGTVLSMLTLPYLV